MRKKADIAALRLPFAVRYSGAVLAVLVLLILNGCGAATKELAGKKDLTELYDNGTRSYQAQRYEESERNFKALMEDFPLSKYAVDAQLKLGDVYYGMERYEDANSYYTNFAALHPRNPKADYALFQKGMCHFKDVLSVDRDQTSTRKAIFALQDLISAHPNSPYVPRAREIIAFLRNRLAERELYVARFYYKGKNYKGALGRLRDLLKSYPDSTWTATALYYIGESYTGLGEKKLAKDAYTTLISDFPDSSYAGDARKRLSEG
ncbi:MAG: outer membrane protein assembly factor BamD [Deltaproteobacteria bacterium]|nr:outer membrane protein assembly factor BamD [Deltaproteobacteria bacterium]